MGTFRQFEQDLRDAASHLFDPTYQPTDLLCAVMGCDPSAGLQPVQAVIQRAIAELEPGAGVPPQARSQRLYDLLSLRYLQQLTQEEAAERLGITSRHLRREQQMAVATLARHLWRRSHPEAAAEEGEKVPPLAHRGADEGAEWRSQVRQELAVLRKSTPGSIAEVGEAISAVVALAQSVTSRHGVTLRQSAVEPGLFATIHASGLRQILIGGITELLRHMAAGAIELAAAREGGRVGITLTGTPARVAGPFRDAFTQELLAVHGGSAQFLAAGNALALRVDLASAGRVRVLVVDDNRDLVHFYQRYTVGTRYEIVLATEGRPILAEIEALAPDVIILDVMLPDVDGWELLVHLHEHPAARSIPVIVCSVVREEELALALGALLYLPKPVGRRQFIEALDYAVGQAGAEGPRGSAPSTPPG